MKIYFLTLGDWYDKNRNMFNKNHKDLVDKIITNINEKLDDGDLCIVLYNDKVTKEKFEAEMYTGEIKIKRDINFEYFLLSDIDNPGVIAGEINKIITSHFDKGYRYILNYTGGTKSIVSAAVAMFLLRKVIHGMDVEFIFIGCEKRENGECVKSNRVMSLSNVNEFEREYTLHLINESMKTLSFDNALNFVKRLSNKEQNIITHFIKFYKLWDAMSYEMAYGELEQIGLGQIKLDGHMLNISKDIVSNMKKLPKNGKEWYKFFIIDLYNNAKRRIEQGMYDDATARLYRLVEAIAQYVLVRDYNIVDEGGISLENIRKYLNSKFGDTNIDAIGKKLSKIKESFGDKTKYNLALINKYKLLYLLGSDFANKIIKFEDDKPFLINNEFQALLNNRNNSILAHGSMSITKEDVVKFINLIDEYLLSKLSLGGTTVKDLIDSKEEDYSFPRIFIE